jgi:hypothetical protein
MNFRSENKKPKTDSAKHLKDPRRRANCETSLSSKLPHGKNEPAGPRGACAPEASVQGSE